MDVSLWQESDEPAAARSQPWSGCPANQPDPELEAFRRQLEGLL
jgi:hypothetical protein